MSNPFSQILNISIKIDDILKQVKISEEDLQIANKNNDRYLTGEEASSIFEKYKGLSAIYCKKAGIDEHSFDNIKGLTIESNAQQNQNNSNQAVLNNLRSVMSDGSRERKIPKSLDEIPSGSHDNIHDARFCDISKLNLTKEELLNLTIDDSTIMNDEQKKIIQEYTEKMKDPGLGIRQLHTQGVTGKGVHMAIIDQPLAPHKEYNENLRSYKETGFAQEPETGAMHGSAVTSIAVGQDVGVAPDATVDYYAAENGIWLPSDKQVNDYITNLKDKLKTINPESNYAVYIKQKINSMENAQKEYETQKSEIEKNIKNAKTPEEKAYLTNKLSNLFVKGRALTTNASHISSIKEILAKNETLPQKDRVSVISISWGFDEFAPDYNELLKTIDEAKKQGVFVISTSLNTIYQKEFQNKDFNGANRDPQMDVSDPKSYEAGAFWKRRSANFSKEKADNSLLLPMDHRAVADYRSETGYRYEGNDGGMSWATPYLAGCYALAKQVKPDITPEEFFKIAMDTSDECHNQDDNQYVGRLINPQKLIEKLKNK